MANKSYASSEVGADESRFGQDPEGSKDFNKAYQQVRNRISNTLQCSWWRKFTRNRAIHSLYHKMRFLNLNIA